MIFILRINNNELQRHYKNESNNNFRWQWSVLIIEIMLFWYRKWLFQVITMSMMKFKTNYQKKSSIPWQHRHLKQMEWQKNRRVKAKARRKAVQKQVQVRLRLQKLSWVWQFFGLSFVRKIQARKQNCPFWQLYWLYELQVRCSRKTCPHTIYGPHKSLNWSLGENVDLKHVEMGFEVSYFWGQIWSKMVRSITLWSAGKNPVFMVRDLKKF